MEATGTSSICSNNSFCDTTGQGINRIHCHCNRGFHGNPYLPNGCQDINECLTPEFCPGGCKKTDGSFICTNNKKAKAAIIDSKSLLSAAPQARRKKSPYFPSFFSPNNFLFSLTNVASGFAFCLCLHYDDGLIDFLSACDNLIISYSS